MLHIARLLFAGLLLPALMLCAHVGAANAQQPKWAVSYSGIDVAKDAYYSYSGIVVSTKRDLSKSGIMLQGFMGYGGYDYDNPSVTGGNVDGDLLQFSGLVGYMFVRSTGSASVYVGVDYQDHDLDPADPSNEISGSEVGFKVTGDVRHVTDQHYLTLEGSYSTAFNA